jgi:type IV pilus assembly protein PilA
MKNKKGFTLIELLAVIVILAIIALIATPIVLNMINNARKKAAESSAYGFIDAIEYNNGFAQTEQAGYTEINGENLDATSINVKMKGKKPTSGTVTIVDGKVTNANICVEGYTVVYEKNDVTSTTKGCNNSTTPEVIWDNYITPTQASGTTLPSGSFIWIQENTTSGVKELCGKIDGTNEVCLTNDPNGRASDFADVSTTTSGITTTTGLATTGLKGYSLKKAEEMLSSGAKNCYVSSYEMRCSGGPVRCKINSDGSVLCFDYTGFPLSLPR